MINLSTLLITTCPPGAAIGDIPNDVCLENLGQLQKVIFTRMKNGSTLNQVSVASAPTLATWTALEAAVDGTKIQVSPIIEDPQFEAGEFRESGGGNATLGGIPYQLGNDRTQFTGMFKAKTQDKIKAMKTFRGEDMGVYLVFENNIIVGNEKVADELHPFKIYGLNIGDKVPGGFEEVDSNAITFYMLPNWSDDLKAVTATFDTLVDLVNE